MVRDHANRLDQCVRIESDQTAHSRVKDFYMPIPARQRAEVARKRKPGSTITPREWQQMVQEAKGQRRGAEVQDVPTRASPLGAEGGAEPPAERSKPTREQVLVPGPVSCLEVVLPCTGAGGREGACV
jgi:hypothetical protein